MYWYLFPDCLNSRAQFVYECGKFMARNPGSFDRDHLILISYSLWYIELISLNDIQSRRIQFILWEDVITMSSLIPLSDGHSSPRFTSTSKTETVLGT
jgi:hypothetical protein